MKEILNVILAFLILIYVSGCTESSPLISDEDLMVVWGFVYANEPITDIKLTRTLPLDADSSSEFSTINDAEVAVIVNGDRFECELASGDSGIYQYLANDLSINSGNQTSIEIEWQGQSIKGESTVPQPPSGLELESNIMEIPNFSDRQSFMEWRQSENQEVVVTWETESEDDWFYVVLKNLEQNPTPIEINSTFSERMREIIFPPVQDNSYRIRLPLIEFLGLHEIQVYRVNREYVDLYESRAQDTRDLNEPLTNIEGGLGVFSAFNSSKINMTVIQN
jgi:hypothetical protein|tara:strand:+ start:497 stop:1333 length:837 start_codon:yes stop_codon:yes gene_type:complete